MSIKKKDKKEKEKIAGLKPCNLNSEFSSNFPLKQGQFYVCLFLQAWKLITKYFKLPAFEDFTSHHHFPYPSFCMTITTL